MSKLRRVLGDIGYGFGIRYQNTTANDSEIKNYRCALREMENIYTNLHIYKYFFE